MVSDSYVLEKDAVAAYPINADTPINVPIKANLNQGILEVIHN